MEACPICVRTGKYADQRGNLVEPVHDPLGLEAVCSKARFGGELMRFDHYVQQPVGSVDGLADRLDVQSFVVPGLTGDRNPLRIGVVVVAPKSK